MARSIGAWYGHRSSQALGDALDDERVGPTAPWDAAQGRARSALAGKTGRGKQKGMRGAKVKARQNGARRAAAPKRPVSKVAPVTVSDELRVQITAASRAHPGLSLKRLA